MKKEAKVKELKKDEVKIPYILTNYLVEKINVLKVPTYGDIQKFKKIQEVISSVSDELQSKIREIFNKYGVTEVNEGDEHFDSINKDYQELLKSVSSISRDSLQIFNKSDFERVYNGSNLNVNDALTLEYWLVK